jgi:hypothetical protein
MNVIVKIQLFEHLVHLRNIILIINNNNIYLTKKLKKNGRKNWNYKLKTSVNYFARNIQIILSSDKLVFFRFYLQIPNYYLLTQIFV